MISILATGEKTSNNNVWGTFINAGGWKSDGVSFCLGFLTPAFALAGVDAVVHMSEESYNAALNVPRAMIWSVIINGLAGFAYILTVLYSITDTEAVLATPTGFPIIAVFLQATNNQKAATAMMTAVIIISTSNKCPTNAVLSLTVAVSLLSRINIGSTTAFNALISLTTLGFYFSCTIPTILFAIRRFNRPNPIDYRPWTMGKIGLAVNILAATFCVVLIIFLPFPPVLPVTGVNMNYASPVFVAVMVFAVINYVVRARKRFTGPIKEVISKTSSDNLDLQLVIATKHVPSG
ncbi:hypothetical protein LTR84_012304 [Exophiala bonariae]|uniref:Amino acid permease/ SLC12A domain-containing protein n=1 Tax=Exophiala bonariae TaxID=1690606 RepID=A0AAV9NFU5_9EURO|nr:hypothetical protein LTR84_012304 [Exophiala bonariae]